MQVEIRADKKSMAIGGYVNVVGRDSRVLHDKTGPYVEQIMPGAFAKAISAPLNAPMITDIPTAASKPTAELLPIAITTE